MVPRTSGTIPAALARRIAVAAQGLERPRPLPGAQAGIRRLRAAVAAAGIVQIDSVNVVARGHDLTLFARAGAHPPGLLPRLAYGPPPQRRELFEYWAHEASYVPVGLQPFLRWRMERAAGEAWGRMVRIVRDRPELVGAVLDEVAATGPVAASELTMATRRGGSWWGWGEAKTAVEWLFWAGQLTAVGRRPSFERVYDLTERAMPPAVLVFPTPPEEDARRELVRYAAAHLGVATAADLADVFRLRVADVRPRIGELAEEGVLVPATVEGWAQPAWLHAGARLPRVVHGRALLAPFDPLVWYRPRVERLFGMRYRIEIYTPAPRRVHGYYVLPFLLGDRLVARVDLKAARAAGQLVVLAAHPEPGSEPGVVAGPLAQELEAMAAWLGLGAGVDVAAPGLLAEAVVRALRRGQSPASAASPGSAAPSTGV